MKSYHVEMSLDERSAFLYVPKQWDSVVLGAIKKHRMWGGGGSNKSVAIEYNTGTIWTVWYFSHSAVGKIVECLKAESFVSSPECPDREW